MDAEEAGFAQFVAARERALQRTAWLLTGDWALAEDLSEAQVAEVLDCTVGTVKSTMSRALAKLREDPRLAEFMNERSGDRDGRPVA